MSKMSKFMIKLFFKFLYKSLQEPYSQNTAVSHHLSAKLTACPSEQLILDSQQILRQTVTLAIYILQNQLILLA